MAKMLPPLTWFRSFEAAARTLSFTAAAEEVGLTQSAVSQQVKSLELRLGVPLFVRRPRGLMLTDDGRRLLPQVGAALETLARATGGLGAGSSVDLVTVAASVSVAQWLITPRLPEFTRAWPDTRIRLLSAIWPDDFHTARADVEIRFGSEKQVGKGARALTPDRLVAVKSPALQGPLADLPLIETVGTSGGWQVWRAEIGPVPQPSLYTDTYGMALQAAAHGNGVALVNEWLAGHAIATGQLERAHPQAIPGEEGYFLSQSETSPAARAFCDWLLDL